MTGEPPVRDWNALWHGPGAPRKTAKRSGRIGRNARSLSSSARAGSWGRVRGNTAPEGDGRHLGAVGDAELAEFLLQVDLDGDFLEVEFPGDALLLMSLDVEGELLSPAGREVSHRGLHDAIRGGR